MSPSSSLGHSRCHHEKDGHNVDRTSGNRQAKRSRLHQVLIHEFQKHSIKNFLLHEVYLVPDKRQTARRNLGFLRKVVNNAFCVVAFHTDHWHVIHDCSYQSNQSRCAFVQRIAADVGRRVGRRVIPPSNMQAIPCSIYKRENDKSITYKSEGNHSHDLIVKFDCYNYSACQGLSKEN
ncbi:hypothetical protein M8J75_003237 [Diaphorina citri]|nr:hypothetical protein M8J75_003237 [Diaphorina citri]KAI5708493.1 hypothetical protein M8J77_023828 [Diaphorina citri]